MTHRLFTIALVLVAGTTVAAAVAAGTGGRSVGDVLEKYGPAADARLRPSFEAAGVPYPPEKVALIAFKDEAMLELWAEGGEGRARFIRTYVIRAASGGMGPKLRQGDEQVPEGIYRVVGLNPNSNYHLSMKLDYPNSFDREMAAGDRRTNLGGDIFVHGKAESIGCLAMGDRAIEELFTLVARTGARNATAVIAPYDLRPGGANPRRDDPELRALPWQPRLYADISRALARYPRGR